VRSRREAANGRRARRWAHSAGSRAYIDCGRAAVSRLRLRGKTCRERSPRRRVSQTGTRVRPLKHSIGGAARRRLWRTVVAAWTAEVRKTKIAGRRAGGRNGDMVRVVTRVRDAGQPLPPPHHRAHTGRLIPDRTRGQIEFARRYRADFEGCSRAGLRRSGELRSAPRRAHTPR